MPRLGATPAEWRALARLVLPDLLPSVADPSVPLYERSALKSPDSKVPSHIVNGKVMGIPAWNDSRRRTVSIDEWIEDDRLAAGMACRTVRALDVDIDDIDHANEVEDFILDFLGADLPRRDRSNSGKHALLYRIDDAPAVLRKGVVHTRNGDKVEFMGDNQFLVLAGTHPSGVRYSWPTGIPTSLAEVPVFSMKRMLELFDALQDKFTPPGKVSRWRYHGDLLQQEDTDWQRISDDPVVKFLEANNLIVGYGSSGLVHVTCPWCDPATATTPLKVGDASYIPPGVNGLIEPGFKCFHTSHPEKTYTDFIEHIGYRAQEIRNEFSVIPSSSDSRKLVPADSRPVFTMKGKSGQIASTLPNLVAMLNWTAGFGFVIRYDRFKDMIVYRPSDSRKWEVLDDDTYTEFRLRAVACGMDPVIGKDLIRDAVSFVAKLNAVDTAVEWLTSLKWDGVPRVAGFLHRCVRCPDTDYHRAVSEYMWTAMAGRVMEPGCKADMVPVFSGWQGQRKSTLIAMLAPTVNESVEIDLSMRDDNLARLLRGKLTTEWTELKGMNSRDAESIKGWITQAKDEWVPKFKEFGTALPRRFIIFGTTNHRRYLNDPTGLRRWLPLVVTEIIDIDYLIEHRDQLWAEAREMFLHGGIRWQDAEQLAKAEHHHAVLRDPWCDAVERWLRGTDKDGFTSTEALSQACSVPVAHMDAKAQHRMQRALVALGRVEDEHGRWWLDLA